MLDRLRIKLSPPIFEDDEDRTRMAGLLNLTLLATLVMGLIFVPIGILTKDSYRGIVIIMGILTAMTPFMLLSLRWGYVISTSVLFVSLFFIACFSSVSVVGTIRTPIASLFIINVVEAGLLFGNRGTVAVTVLSLVALSGAWWLEITGLLPPYRPAVVDSIETHAALLLGTAVLLIVFARNFNDALERARRNEQALTESNRRLEVEIIERKKAAEALAASETLYRTLFEAANDAVFLHGLKPDGSPDTFIAVNNVAIQRLGFSMEELAALTPADIDASEFAEERCRAVEEVQSNGHVTFEMVHQAKDSRRIPVEISSRLFVMNDRTFVLSVARDITERKCEEDALRESEDRFRMLAAASFEGIACAVDGRIVDANEQFASLVSYERSELIGLDVSLMIAPEDRQRVVESIKSGKDSAFEHDMLRKDGSRFTVEARGRTLKHKGSNARYAVLRDITERKNAEKILRESEERYRQIAENIREVFWIADPDLARIIYVSPAYEEVWGQTCESLYADPRSWSKYIHPEDRQRVREAILSRAPQGHSVEYRIIRPDGSIRWVLDRGFPVLNEAREIYRVAGIAEDITERKLAEERLREYEKAVEGLEEMIAVVNHDYRYLIANRAFLKYRGMERNHVLGRSVAEVLGKDIFEKAVKKNLDECFQGNVITYEMKYNYPGPGDRDMLVSYFPIEGPTGVDRVASVLQDITERKRMEQELRQSRDELELRVQERTAELEKANEKLRLIPSRLIVAQEEERKRLASELHDSIGQTLAALKFRMEFVDNTLRDGEVEEALRHIEEFIPTIQRSIDETRAIYMGLRPKVLEDFGVIAALFWCRDGLLSLNPTTHIEIEIGIDESEIPQEIVIPIFRIAQEAVNNAIKHSESEWVDLRLVKDGAEIEMVVSDDGVGMDVHQILQSSTARSLGLTSMRERAELTGGKFTIESTPGEGTTIRVCWPV